MIWGCNSIAVLVVTEPFNATKNPPSPFASGSLTAVADKVYSLPLIVILPLASEVAPKPLSPLIVTVVSPVVVVESLSDNVNFAPAEAEVELVVPKV